MSTIERYGDKNKNMDRNQCDKSWSTTKAPLSPLGPKMKQQNRRCSQKKKARAADKQTRYDAEEVPQIAIWLASWFILPRVDVLDSISFFPFLVAFIDQENRGGTDPGKTKHWKGLEVFGFAHSIPVLSMVVLEFSSDRPNRLKFFVNFWPWFRFRWGPSCCCCCWWWWWWGWACPAGDRWRPMRCVFSLKGTFALLLLAQPLLFAHWQRRPGRRLPIGLRHSLRLSPFFFFITALVIIQTRRTLLRLVFFFLHPMDHGRPAPLKMVIYQVLPGFTGFYRVLPGFHRIRLNRVAL